MDVWIDEMFLQILNMSFTGSYCILAVLLIRLLLKKQPKIFSYALWFIVLFRLVCPVSVESAFSVLPTAGWQSFISQSVQTMYDRGETEPGWNENTEDREKNSTLDDTRVIQNVEKNGVVSSDGSVLGNGEDPEGSGVQSSGTMQDSGVQDNGTMQGSRLSGALWNSAGFWHTVEIIWLAGVLAMLVYAAGSAALLRKKLKAAEKKEGYYVLEQLETPFVFGIAAPKIYLPADLTEKERAYILEHERTHIRRMDYLVRPISFLILCIHWFNPFVWLAFFYMGKDMEMSCDEAVLKKMGKEIKREYSTSLLKLACDRRFFSGSPLAFGEGEVKGRIKNILNYKKPGFWGILLAVAVIAAAGITLLSNPKSPKDTEQTETGNSTGEENGNDDRENENIDAKNGNTDAENENTDAENEVPQEQLPVFGKEEEEQLKELLASYGELNWEEDHNGTAGLKYKNDMVEIDPINGEVSGLERWVTFCSHAEKGKGDAVLFLNYTVEGDAVLRYLSYKDGNYYIMNDSTRDTMGSQTYLSQEFPYMREYYDAGFVEYYLTEEEEFGREQVMEYYLSSAVNLNYVFGLPYAYLESYLGAEEVGQMERSDLEACIINAILTEEKSPYELKFETEAHYILEIEENEDKITVYAHVLYQGYNESQEEEAGSYMPVAITFSKEADGTYQMKEYWRPKDGTYYQPSIEEKFPEDIWEKALDGQSYVSELQAECEEKAQDYFNGQE